MKKLLVIILIYLLIGTASASALPLSLDKKEITQIPIETSTFKGKISQESETIGNFSGIYSFFPVIKDGFAIIKFNCQWEITMGGYSGNTGIVNGIGGINFQIGIITSNEIGKKLLFISQISFTEVNKVIDGEIKIIFGSTFHINGNYQ